MNFELTEEQRILVRNARKFLKDEIEPIADELDRKGPMPKEVAHQFIKRLIPFGYINCCIPEKDGGMGLDHLTFGLLLEEIKKVYPSLGGIVSIAQSAAYTIATNGTDEQKKRFLPGLLSGDLIGCMGITEPNVGSDVKSIQTTAELKGDYFILNGTKMWISNGSISDLCIVLCKTEKGLSRIIVEKKVSSYQTREIPKMGLKSFPTSEIVFDNVKVPKENLLSEQGRGFKDVMKAFNTARCNLAVGCVGIMQAATDASIKYAKERIQFKKQIASFQLIQDMIADMIMLTEASRMLAYRALYYLDRKEDATIESSIAKSFCSESAVKVTSIAIQIHGAYGLSDEYRVERYFRDARCYTIPDGTTQIQKLIIGREATGIKAFE